MYALAPLNEKKVQKVGPVTQPAHTSSSVTIVIIIFFIKNEEIWIKRGNVISQVMQLIRSTRGFRYRSLPLNTSLLLKVRGRNLDILKSWQELSIAKKRSPYLNLSVLACFNIIFFFLLLYHGCFQKPFLGTCFMYIRHCAQVLYS